MLLSGSLEGHDLWKDECSLWNSDHSLVTNDLTVTCEVVSGNEKLIPPVQTAYKPFTNRIRCLKFKLSP